MPLSTEAGIKLRTTAVFILESFSHPFQQICLTVYFLANYIPFTSDNKIRDVLTSPQGNQVVLSLRKLLTVFNLSTAPPLVDLQTFDINGRERKRLHGLGLHTSLVEKLRSPKVVWAARCKVHSET